MRFTQFNRVVHRWGSMVVAVPLFIMILSGLPLLLKKEVSWVQPATQRGSTKELSLDFDQVLDISRSVPEARIESWDDVDRLDVRPSKGMLKVRAANRWEIQMDAQSGEILQVAYRRSDFIESIHDGSFFHEKARLWIFLPAGVLLLLVWLTGIYLFFMFIYYRWRARRSRRAGEKKEKPPQTGKATKRSRNF